MPLIRITDQAYKEIKELMDQGITARIEKLGYCPGTISKTASALIHLAIENERLNASLTSSQL